MSLITADSMPFSIMLPSTALHFIAYKLGNLTIKLFIRQGQINVDRRSKVSLMKFMTTLKIRGHVLLAFRS
jgi:hypothetical protein